VNRFLDFGEEGLRDARRDNGQAKVDADMMQALAEIVAGSPEDHGWPRPTWTREMLASTLLEKTGTQVSVTTVARMLKNLRARWGMARPTVLCPWSKTRKSRRVRKILRVVENLPAREVAFFEDEVDIHLNPDIGRDWMLHGQQKIVVTPGQNKKRYVAGALSTRGDGLVFVSAERKNSDLFIALLERLRQVHASARRIHLVLDNYVIHSSRRVQKFLQGCGDLFVLHFLPPYSPDHNRIERLWRELHANVTRNHRCATIDELMRKVNWYLRRKNKKLQQRSAAVLNQRRRARSAA